MSVSASPDIVDKLFSSGVFTKLDKNALLQRYDQTSALRAANAPLLAPPAPLPQTGFLISEIPPEGISIGTPGFYSFSGDIAWSPADVACSAIYIESDGVVLDLGGFTLTATITDNSQLVAGINVRNVAGVGIQNGTVRDMCLYGIYADNVSVLSINNMTISGLSYDNLALSCTPSGIYIDKATTVSITGCTVQDCTVTANSCAGILMQHTAIATVSGCQVSNLRNLDGGVSGYACFFASAVNTVDCTATALQSYFQHNTKTLGHTVLGFICSFCFELSYEGCTSTDMTGSCDDCHGMSVFLDACVRVARFSARNVTDGPSPYDTGAKATGLEVYGAFISISDCSAENIVAYSPQDKQGTGFSAWGNNIVFDGCTARDVSVRVIYGSWHPGLGYGTGFGWAPDPRPEFCYIGALNVEYNNCRAQNCQVGFDTWYHVDSTWTNPIADGCGIPILVQSSITTRTLTADACSEGGPAGITTVLTNIAMGNTYPGS